MSAMYPPGSRPGSAGSSQTGPLLGPHLVGRRVVVRRALPGRTGPSGGPALTDHLGVLEAWGDHTLTIRGDDGTTVVVDRAEVVAGKAVPPRPAASAGRVDVAEAEARAMDTWPPVEAEPLGGWTLRASGGFSARANSALALGEPDLPWEEALSRVVGFYRTRGLPPWVQAMVGSPEVARLQGSGWESARPGEAPTSFHLAGLTTVRRAARRAGPSDPPEVEVSAALSEAWLADDGRARSHRAAATAVLTGPPHVGFAAVRGPSGVVVAKGRGALSERGDVWLGISDVWVHPERRRSGLAVTVLAALCSWAAERGATTAYLQTREDNAPALALYERLGFVRHHTYRYLRPGPGAEERISTSPR
jgi:ribosomal protein S18 acetylase RimI-like enzyme